MMQGLLQRKWTPDEFAVMLLGHVGGGGFAIRDWLTQAGGPNGATNPGMSSEAALEFGLVNLMDERLALAAHRLQMVLFQNTPMPETPITTVTRLALAWVNNRQRNFDAADGDLRRAIESAERLGLKTVYAVAGCLWASNRSDGGAPSAPLIVYLDQLDLPSSAAPAQHAAAICRVIAWYEVLVRARLDYRSGQQHGALTRLTEQIGRIDRDTGEQSPIVFGSLLRMRGILYTFSGNPAAARDDLRAAQRCFESVGYEPGVIRCTLSMARSNLFLDRQEAERDIQRARQILEEHEPGFYPRDMVAERAYLESRIGDIFFTKGDFHRAYEHYQNDRTLTESLGSPRRATAYVHYNLGRVQTTLGRYADAAQALHASVTLFEQAADPFNELQAGLHLALAHIEAGDFASASQRLHVLQRLLDGPAESVGHQPKQTALLHTLWALIEVRHLDDPSSALARLMHVKALLAPWPKDAYFIRALLAETEAEVKCSRVAVAADLVARAERLAEAGYMFDLKQYAAALRRRLGLPDTASSLVGSIQAQVQQSSTARAQVQAAVLVVEVRGYADFAEDVGARSVMFLANLMAEFAEAMAGCAEVHDGELVRFDGDSVLVVFEDRILPKEIKAVQAALLMEQRFRDLRERWLREGKLALRDGATPFGLGIGIASGPAVAGHFGRATHRDFALIGGAVNQAFTLARGGRDGGVRVSRRVIKIIEESWPEVSCTPIEVDEGGGRMFRCGEIDAGRLYPLPRLHASG
jgi:class 3 adenylate cyclase